MNLPKQYIILITFLITTLQLQSQCYPDRHSTDWFDSWISCERSASPDGSGDNHWILYDLETVHDLFDFHFWNLNIPEKLNDGILQYEIVTSLDSSQWDSQGIFSMSKATGENTYEGEFGPNLSGSPARFVLLKVVSNHGGSCVGISEVRFNTTEQLTTSVETKEEWKLVSNCLKVNIYPNPFIQDFSVSLNSSCPGGVNIQLVDVTGRMLFQKKYDLVPGDQKLDLSSLNLVSGTYFLNILHEGNVSRNPLIKI